MSRYEDIINLPHRVPKDRKPMSTENRVAQSAPFAALADYDDTISEVTRLADARIILSPDEMEELLQYLNQALENITEGDSYTFIYLIPDSKKSGEKYETVTGTIKSFNEHERAIELEDGDVLRIDDIVPIPGEVFDKDQNLWYRTTIHYLYNRDSSSNFEQRSIILRPISHGISWGSEHISGTYAITFTSGKWQTLSLAGLIIPLWSSVLELHTPRLCITFPFMGENSTAPIRLPYRS